MDFYHGSQYPQVERAVGYREEWNTKGSHPHTLVNPPIRLSACPCCHQHDPTGEQAEDQSDIDKAVVSKASTVTGNPKAVAGFQNPFGVYFGSYHMSQGRLSPSCPRAWDGACQLHPWSRSDRTITLHGDLGGHWTALRQDGLQRSMETQPHTGGYRPKTWQLAT